MLKKIPLLAWVVFAIVLGLCLGLCAPAWFVSIFVTFNGIFEQLLGFVVPLIILGLVTPAIANMGGGAKRILLLTVAIAYTSTVLSGLFSYGVSSAVFPEILPESSIGELDSIAFSPYFSISIPPVMNVMTALVLAFVVGLGIVATNASSLQKAFNEFKTIVEAVISRLIVPLLPVYILGTFMTIAAKGDVGAVLGTFIRVIAVIFAMTLVILILQFTIAGLIAHRNPFKALATMLPAYLTALGTSSSAATIPVTLKCTIDNGTDESVGDVVVPLCATIHMSGSILKITSCAVAVMLMYHMPFSLGLFVEFIMLLGITAVAAPGVPGGVIMASLGVLSSVLGFTGEQLTLMITLYVVMDSFGTACNVTGDGAIALIINKLKK